MLESIISATTTSGTTTSLGMAFLYSVIAGVLGLLISITYMKTGKVSKNFARTLIILPILVCVVMLVVNGNLGTSVAIVGAFSLIRFRPYREAQETLHTFSLQWQWDLPAVLDMQCLASRLRYSYV